MTKSQNTATYTLDEIKDRLWAVLTEALVLASPDGHNLSDALRGVQFLSPGTTGTLIKFVIAPPNKTACSVFVKVRPDGVVLPCDPELLAGFGNLFDKSGPRALAGVFEHAVLHSGKISPNAAPPISHH